MKATALLNLSVMTASALAAEVSDTADKVNVELQFPAEEVTMAVLEPATTSGGFPWTTVSSMAVHPTTYRFSGKPGKEQVFFFDTQIKDEDDETVGRRFTVSLKQTPVETSH